MEQVKAQLLVRNMTEDECRFFLGKEWNKETKEGLKYSIEPIENLLLVKAYNDEAWRKISILSDTDFSKVY